MTTNGQGLLDTLKERISFSNNERDDYEIQTIFKPQHKSNGIYVGFSGNYAEIDKGTSAIFLGSRLSWVVNHNFAIGFGGYGFTTDVFNGTIISNKQIQIDGGYGGLYLEPIIGSKLPVHITLPTLFGVGGIGYRAFDFDEFNSWDDYYYENDVILVLEPGIDVELNLTRHLRFNIHGSYRLVQAFDYGFVKSPDLNGLSVGLGLKAGWF